MQPGGALRDACERDYLFLINPLTLSFFVDVFMLTYDDAIS